MIAGSAVGAVSFMGGRGAGVGAGLTAGAGAMPLLTCVTVMPAGETDWPEDGAGAALSALGLSLADAALPEAGAFSAAAANASGTAESSDTSTAKRNNLFIIIPPNTLMFFF